VLVGSGYAVELSLDSLTFRWAHSIVGRATALTVNSRLAKWGLREVERRILLRRA